MILPKVKPAEEHKDRRRSLDDLIKEHNGMFRSESQLRHFRNIGQDRINNGGIALTFDELGAVVATSGQFVVEVWASPVESDRRCLCVLSYLCDSTGIIRKTLHVYDGANNETDAEVRWERTTN